ncbi:hypothetical protein F2P79_019674 [Pimephales promelas]|nr:hypothetical protein F2P79_019674 [Pimephales promelas]
MLGFSAVLLLLLLVSSSVQDPVIRLSCLTTTNTRIPMKNLVGYNIQNKPLFPVIAISYNQRVHNLFGSLLTMGYKSNEVPGRKEETPVSIKYSSSFCDSGS